jgi:hypothetical protein
MGSDPISRMLGEQKAREETQALSAFIRQLVTQQIGVAMSAYNHGLNHLASQIQMQITFAETIRRILEEKGLITTEEFEAEALKLQENSKRAHEIAHDLEIDRDERVKQLMELCELPEEHAVAIVDQVAQSVAGAGQPQAEPEEEESDESGSEEPAESGTGDDQARSELLLP